MRLIVRTLLFVLFLSLISAATLYARVGDRPMPVGARATGMGGAFVAVADDAYAAYYNPAGLSQLKKREGTFTSLVNNAVRNKYLDYNDIIIYANPDEEYGAWAGWFVHSGSRLTGEEKPEYWYCYSYGKEVLRGFSLGGNLRYIWGNTRHPNVSDHAGALDLALLYRPVKWFSAGLLIQDLTESEHWGEEYDINFRPGVAFRPDRLTVVACDLYDATGETDDTSHDASQDVRVGVERWITKHRYVALRGGVYHIGSMYKAYTGGLGLRFEIEQIEYRFDYAYFAHQKRDEEERHYLGLTVAF
ncbi:hypothetical protein KAT51_08330 [bacterium]|nr:hypothetical protein [bacterium]